MKQIAAAVLTAALFLACLPTSAAAAKAEPKKPPDEADTALSELPLSFEFDAIEPRQMICIGRIEIRPDTVYQLDAATKQGEDLVAALNPSPRISNWGTGPWHQHYGTYTRSLTAYFHEIDWEGTQKPTDVWYVYVGSFEGRIEGVSGTLYVQE